MKWLRLLAALLALLPAAWTNAAQPPAVSAGRLQLDSNALQTRQLALDGTWHFFAGRWITPAGLAAAAAGAGRARVPGGWPGATHGLGTYWLEIAVDKPIPATTLRLNLICGAADVYFFRSGAPTATPLLTAGRPGRSAAAETPSGDHQAADIPPLQPGIYNLLIDQSNFHLRAGGLCGRVTWGTVAVQTHVRALNIVKNTTVAAMLLSLALGSLLLGSQNRERAAPWLALMCMTCAVLIAFNSGLLSVLLPPASSWRGHFNYFAIFAALIWMPLALLMVFHHTFNIAMPRWLVRANLAAPVLLTLGLALSLTFFMQHPLVLAVTWCIQSSLAFVVLATACRRRRQYAGFAAVAGAVLLFSILFDLYRFFAEGVIEISIPYAIAFLAAVHSGIYTLKFGSSYKLAARLSANLQEEVDLRTRELRDKNYNLEQTQNALRRANESLRELSITDGLTRVYNRMYFEQQYEREWRRCARQASPLSMLMIDADHFKQLNDSAGHLVGDICLQSIAKEIQRHFKRSGEVVARYGGEEFIVLLPESNQNQALAAAEGLRQAIERLAFNDGAGSSYRVTVSIGVSSTVPGLDQRPEQLTAAADAALYEAKDAGRNRVHSIPLGGGRTAMAQQTLRL